VSSTKALGIEEEVSSEGTFTHHLLWPYGVDLLLATFDKREAVSIELNDLQLTFPLLLKPQSVPVVTAHAGREHNFSTICALQQRSRLILGRGTLHLNKAELKKEDVRSEWRAGIPDPMLRKFQKRRMLL